MYVIAGREFINIAHFEIWHGVRYKSIVFKKTPKIKWSSSWWRLCTTFKMGSKEIENIISGHLLALYSHVIPLFICFLVWEIHFWIYFSVLKSFSNEKKVHTNKLVPVYKTLYLYFDGSKVSPTRVHSVFTKDYLLTWSIKAPLEEFGQENITIFEEFE